jgi:DNA repair exonuclease SbcCD ATPase subunit
MTLWSDGKTNEDIQKLAETNSNSVVYNLHEDLLCVKEQLEKANERVEELEKELKESEDDLDAAEQQLSSYENALEEVQAVFVDSDACPLFEPFNPRNLSAWLNKFAIEKKIDVLDEVESVYMQAAETSEPISFREAFDAVEEKLRKEQVGE